MAITIRITGEAEKRGLLPRLPPPEQLLADARAWALSEYGAVIRSADVRPGDGGSLRLRLDLHPAAEPLEITADVEGHVAASADTTSAGPGYHTFVARFLERLGWEHGIGWEIHRELGRLGELQPASTAWVGAREALADRAAVERTHLTLLRDVLVRARDLRAAGAAGMHVGTRPGERYTFDGALATPLGPRDDAWLDRAIRDPRTAVDIRPWWADATNGRYLLARALVILWTEIRWRPPGDEAERAAMDEALGLLRRALLADASLPFPWREWDVLLRLRGVDEPLAGRIADEAGRANPSLPLAGYRRRPVTVTHEGWSLEVPGSFAERRTAEEWWGGERGRTVTLAATATGARGMPMSAEAFLARVAGDLGTDVLHHASGPVRGRARLGTDARSGVEVGVLEGYAAATGLGAAIRVEFERPDDWQWAVGLWRALRPAPASATVAGSALRRPA